MFEFLLNFLHTLTDPEALLALLTSVFSGVWAYIFLFCLIFAETGLLIGFFLPGDSLLFTLGVVAGAGELNIVLLDVVLLAAAIVGNTTGYALGRTIGARAFGRENSFIFNKERLEKTRNFYEKHGGKTIIYAQFVPIIRTFAPFVAGAAQMHYRHFIAYNIVGATIWVISMTLLGFTLGNVPFVRENFEKLILGIIVISLIPPVIEAVKGRKIKTVK